MGSVADALIIIIIITKNDNVTPVIKVKAVGNAEHRSLPWMKLKKGKAKASSLING